MAYIVTINCLGTKDRSCVEVCPVDCFYDIKKKKYNDKFKKDAKGSDVGLLVIHPDECINCGACETECPVQAIYEDSGVPEDLKEFIQINQEESVGMSDEELDAARCTTKVA